MSGYALLIGLGVAFGLGWAVAQAGPRHAERIFSLEVGVLLGALIASRACFVAVNWGYFQAHLLDSLWVWQGGLSGPGALVGGGLGLLAAAWVGRTPPGWLADQTLPLLAALTVAGWLGCWLAGCAYGGVSRAWWAVPAEDEWGISDWRVPVQLLGALLSTGGFAVLVRQRLPIVYPGLAGSLGLLVSGLVLLGLSFLRADPMPAWQGLRADAWGALAVIASALGFGLYCLIASRLERS